MRKFVPIILFPLLFLTSCIEIVEEVTVNPDRSGTISYKIESDRLTALFSNLTGMFDQNSLKEMLTNRFEEFAMKFKNSRGIKNVRFIIGDNITDASLSFDFNNTKELNEALYEIAGSRKTFFSPSYLKIGKHKLKKFNIAPYLKKHMRDQDITLPEDVMKMVQFKSIYNLPDKVKSAHGKSVTLTSDKTAVQKFEFIDVYENKTNTGVRIKF